MKPKKVHSYQSLLFPVNCSLWTCDSWPEMARCCLVTVLIKLLLCAWQSKPHDLQKEIICQFFVKLLSNSKHTDSFLIQRERDRDRDPQRDRGSDREKEGEKKSLQVQYHDYFIYNADVQPEKDPKTSWLNKQIVGLNTSPAALYSKKHTQYWTSDKNGSAATRGKKCNKIANDGMIPLLPLPVANFVDCWSFLCSAILRSPAASLRSRGILQEWIAFS